MDADDKLQLLGDDARFESCDSFTPRRKKGQPPASPGITPTTTPDGRVLNLFRVLQSNSCEWDCPYCPLRRSGDVPRATLAPDELAELFMARHSAGAVQGLFLSTAVNGGLRPAMAAMLDTVELLRVRYAYRGYVHLKLLPGARADEVARAAELADRLSVNLEAPNGERLKRIAPERSWRAIMEPMAYVRDAERAGHVPSGQVTQLVVGAAGETDREIFQATTRMYDEFQLRRVYFNAFRPQPNTPLAAAERPPAVRQQRLQEADWLVRHYDFRPDELPFGPDDQLPLTLDPKMAWALDHPAQFPVEVNTADRAALLRVPGIGPVSVERIVAMRRTLRFRELRHLQKIGVVISKARHFVTLDGKFAGESSAVVGQRLRSQPVVEQLTLW